MNNITDLDPQSGNNEQMISNLNTIKTALEALMTALQERMVSHADK